MYGTKKLRDNTALLPSDNTVAFAFSNICLEMFYIALTDRRIQHIKSIICCSIRLDFLVQNGLLRPIVKRYIRIIDYPV